MNTTSKIMIVKRDGSHEPFAAAKLRRVVALAMRAGRYDAKLADPLVQAVEVHLRCWDEPRPPTSEYVFRCTYAVLKQTGLKDVAEHLAGHRRWRRQKRNAVKLLRTDPRRGAKPWRKASVVALLEQRHGVGHAVARIIAGELELRVLGLGFGEISQRLMDELVRNELAAWGLLEPATAEARAVKPDPDDEP